MKAYRLVTALGLGLLGSLGPAAAQRYDGPGYGYGDRGYGDRGYGDRGYRDRRDYDDDDDGYRGRGSRGGSVAFDEREGRRLSC